MAKAGLENCRCGSKLYAPARYDGHGIFLTYACDTCWPTKRAGFREDIMEQYDADEPIEPEPPSRGDADWLWSSVPRFYE